MMPSLEQLITSTQLVNQFGLFLFQYIYHDLELSNLSHNIWDLCSLYTNSNLNSYIIIFEINDAYIIVKILYDN